MKITVLGCGPSGGVPLIGCDCAVCCSADPKNTRTRASILIETGEAVFLVDTAPDLRQQALRHGIRRIDAVLYTHDHADHTHGIDELRSFNFLMRQPVAVYGSLDLVEKLTRSFAYAFGDHAPSGRVPLPALRAHAIEENQPFELLGQQIQPFLQYHGKGKSLGYRFGNFAYSTDVDKFPEESLQVLESLDVWLVDCLQYDPAATHAYLALTLEWVRQLKPKRTILTHMSHDFDYATLNGELPEGVTAAYDGMVIDIG